MRINIPLTAVVTLCWLLTCQARAYDPLQPLLPAGSTHEVLLTDTKRDREIPLLVSVPQASGQAPVILFSHGLGGSRRACRYLREQWTSRGYIAVFLQHPGSDESVWRSVPRQSRLAAMSEAASFKNGQARIDDVGSVLDALAAWQEEPGHLLEGRLDLEHIGMSGHSFGARTTQAVSGQVGWAARNEPDHRIDAALILSPSAPRLRSAESLFGSVSIPWLLMTGTEDVAAIGSQTVASRLAVFPALPAGQSYELVFDKGTHSAFTDGARTPKDDRNPNHHPAIKAISTAFWDAFLCENPDAKAWLNGAGPRSVLEPADRWQTK